MKLPVMTSEVESVIKPVYAVGGCVRDFMLGKDPKDYDYCTPLLPDDVERQVKLAGKRAHTSGKRFGTIAMTVYSELVEITTFRTEVYGKTRKPEVKFVDSISKDLVRRDFTINAMAMRGQRLIDPFGGKNDLKDGIIRAVGNPSKKFAEDPLRMLRAVRFASELGFEIEPETLKAIQKNAFRILEVSKESWMVELDKMLLGDYILEGLGALLDSDLAMFVMPEFRLQNDYDQNSDYHAFALDLHTIATVSLLPKDITLRWAAFLHDIGKPFVRVENKRGTSNYMHHQVVGAEIVYGIAKRMKWSNDRTAKVCDLVRSHLQDESPLRAADNESKKSIPGGEKK
jgi:tRNA nucleotidyltransferase (CCA-adding enzyme)